MRRSSLPRRMALGALVIAAGCAWAGARAADPAPLQAADGSPLPDLALLPPSVIVAPEHCAQTRRQGIPGIERTARGRLWAVWVRDAESPRSYVVLAASDDDGRTWSPLKLIIQPRQFVRTRMPCLWIDPQNRLWLFWSQNAGQNDGRGGVWALVADQPDADRPAWSPPRRIAHGAMLNKPIVSRTGDWLLPIGLGEKEDATSLGLHGRDIAPYTEEMLSHDLPEERGFNLFRSSDQGQTFERLGQAHVPNRRTPEDMLVERRDGRLWLLARTTGGIGQSLSTDGGKTWGPGSLYLPGRNVANTRFFIRRLQSGALLMVRNNGPSGERSHLTAFVSDDDGESWKGGLLLDERAAVAYPDGVQAPDGTVYVVYDHNRTPEGEILLATFSEEDVRAGQPVTGKVRLRVVVNRLGPAE